MAQLDEHRKSPNTAFKRQGPGAARKRGSIKTITNEGKSGVFNKKIDEALISIGDADFYQLIDEGSEEILCDDFISDAEAVRRNEDLKGKKEPFRWHKNR